MNPKTVIVTGGSQGRTAPRRLSKSAIVSAASPSRQSHWRPAPVISLTTWDSMRRCLLCLCLRSRPPAGFREPFPRSSLWSSALSRSTFSLPRRSIRLVLRARTSLIAPFSFCSRVSRLRRIRCVARAEAAVRQSRDELELKVLERTAELKASEEILRERANLLDLTHDTIFVRRLDNVITYWNRGANELYGWSSHEALGRPSHELLRTEFPEPLKQINPKLLQTSRWEGELIHATRDGRRLVVSSRWSLQRDGRGEPFAILETNTDVTERKRAEEALRQSHDELEVRVKERTSQLSKTNEELQSVNKELEAFAYSVSHDLRAPVRHISGFTELLQKHAQPLLDDKSRHHIATILDSATRMGNLVDDLLGFSRIGRAEDAEDYRQTRAPG